MAELSGVRPGHADFDHANQLDPHLAFSSAAKGVLHSQERDLGGAVASFRAEAKRHPNDALTQYLLAEALAEQGNAKDSPAYKEEIAAANQALRLNPQLTAAHDLLSTIYLHNRQSSLAIEQSRAALKTDPNDQAAVYHLILALRETDQKDQIPALIKRLGELRRLDQAATSQKKRYQLSIGPTGSEPDSQPSTNSSALLHSFQSAWRNSKLKRSEMEVNACKGNQKEHSVAIRSRHNFTEKTVYTPPAFGVTMNGRRENTHPAVPRELRLIVRGTKCIALLAVLASAWQSISANTLRPPAVPLVTNDPYFSIWSPGQHLAESDTIHWSGAAQRLASLVRVDGHCYRLMGTRPATLPALPQVGLNVTATRSIYDFEGHGLHVTLTFMSPLLPTNLEVLSRPVTYLSWQVRSVDHKQHDVSLYYDNTAELVVNTLDEPVVWSDPK